MPVWLKPGNAAVITGGASGIGLESVRRFYAANMNVVLADKNTEARVARRKITDGRRRKK